MSFPVGSAPAPDPAKVGFAPNMMTAERLLQLVGECPVAFSLIAGATDTSGAVLVYVDCGECGQGITAARPTTGVQILADIARHRVNVHGLSLSGSGPAPMPVPDEANGRPLLLVGTDE